MATTQKHFSAATMEMAHEWLNNFKPDAYASATVPERREMLLQAAAEIEEAEADEVAREERLERASRRRLA